MTFTFRPIRDGDEDTVIALWERCNLVVPHNDPHRDLAFARAVENAEVLVGVSLDRLIATVMVGHDGHRGWLYYVAVDPDRQGRGFGSAVVNAAEAWLSERGVPKAQLMIRDTNTKVRDFYTALGWTEEPRIVMSHRPEGCLPIGLGTIETKVTALEMLERPTRPALHPPPGRKITLIRAEPPTVAFYRFLFDRVGASWTWVGRRSLNDDALTEIITDPAVEIYVLHVNGTPAGYGEIDRREGPAKTELTYFGLMPEFIGIGVGWWLLNTVIDLAWSGPCERLWVHTCDLDHPRALGLYQRAGFRPFEQYDETISDPRLLGLPLPQPRHGKPKDGTATPSEDHTVTPIRGERIK